MLDELRPCSGGNAGRRTQELRSKDNGPVTRALRSETLSGGNPYGEKGATMRLEPLYRVRFTYSDSWAVELEGGWEQFLLLAVGRCEGSITGQFRGVNFPQRRTPDGPFLPDFRAVIEADNGATIMFESHGYGRTYPPGRRQIVGSVMHLSDDERYRRLNDVVCVCVGEVRAPEDPNRESPDLVIDVAELIWEPIDG